MICIVNNTRGIYYRKTRGYMQIISFLYLSNVPVKRLLFRLLFYKFQLRAIIDN